jgi:predicted metal-dependent HD superfamily phosphohydrolase
VRADFAHVGDADFRAGRAAVLADLAAKPYLFHTPQARRLWEAAARANLERELTELGRD